MNLITLLIFKLFKVKVDTKKVFIY